MIPKEVIMKIYFLISEAEVLCIDERGVRNILLLKFIKRIQDRINLPILFQKFFKVAFEINLGQYI
jgi:hypothetical protein